MLSGTSETLLFPLFARARESRQLNPILKDDMAVDLLERLNISSKRQRTLRWDTVTAIALSIRARLMDDVCIEFLSRHPEACVLNLGAGLCTRFERVDNGKVQWIDLDLPNMTPVRERLFGFSSRRRFVAASVTDDSWVAPLSEELRGRPVLIIAEGLLVYFTPQEVHDILRRLQNSFAGCEFLADFLHPWQIRFARLHPALRSMQAPFRFGLSDARELEAQVEGLRLLKQWHNLDLHPKRWGFLRLATHISSLRATYTTALFKL